VELAKLINDLVRDFGPIWGPAAIAVIVIFLFVRHRYTGGSRGCKLFLAKSVLIAFCVSALAFFSWYFYFYRYWGLPESFKEGEIGILIAEVPGDDPWRQGQNAYAQAIRQVVPPDLHNVIKVRLLEQRLPPGPEEQHAKAVKVGNWVHASFVLRPFVVETEQKPWLTVVSQPEFSRAEAPLGQFKLAEIDKLPLPGNMVLLARCVLAFSEYKNRDYDDAVGELKVVLESRDLPVVAPSRAGLNLVLGNALYEIDRHDEAITAYNQAIKLKPDDATAHNNLGVALGAAPAEIAEYRQAIKLNPALADAHYNLGSALGHAGKPEEAIAEYRQAIKLKPDFAEAHVNLGTALGQAGMPEEAIAEYRQAIKLKPGFAEAHNNLGAALEGSEREEAIAEFRQAIKLKPGSAGAHYNLGTALGHADKPWEAIAEYRQAIKLKPDFAEAHNNLGTALGRAGKPKEAIAEYRQAIKLKPSFAEVHNNLGFALGQAGETKEAIAEYRQAIKLKPGFAEAHNNLARALFALHQTDEAQHELQTAHRLDPSLKPPHN
jgi:tetratricopeptide (TPR) repeat protein